MASKDPSPFLLLLPPAPSPPNAPALKAAFGDTLSQVLKEVASHSSESSKAAVLEIALACPHLVNQAQTPRADLYDETQTLLAAVYKLICTIAAKEHVNIEDQDGVDVRVLLIAWSPDISNEDLLKTQEGAPYGPVIGMLNLARSQRSWQYAFGVESESGEKMVQAFVAAKGSGESFDRVRSGPVLINDSNRSSNQSAGNETSTSSTTESHIKHSHVAVGGTFDHIHLGHKLLLTMTIFACDQLRLGTAEQQTATIGITGDQLLVNKKYAEVLEAWDSRFESVMAFVNALVDFQTPGSFAQRQLFKRNDPGPNGKVWGTAYPVEFVVKCTEIQDPFGPTITEEQISALVISAETRKGGDAVNEKRKEKGWAPLEVFEVDVLDAEEGGEVQEGFEITLTAGYVGTMGA
ncbi:uncharacterized protein LTR77_003379 [Saxophila tyrrhenica]|uniref:Cytidyltransferase-like domain-containing protein n=1 Tax=Saxophila tyrrhenica TaxID=1690608 RepID=A0AAV9PDF5_9PEZI|nr:hypothetical protein LTR77_003379 [Saxophila tyrrhenica]